MPYRLARTSGSWSGRLSAGPAGLRGLLARITPATKAARPFRNARLPERGPRRQARAAAAIRLQIPRPSTALVAPAGLQMVIKAELLIPGLFLILNMY